MAQALLQALQKNHGEEPLRIHALAPPHLIDLLACMPQIEQTIESPLQHGRLNLKAMFKTAQDLKKESYARAYVLPNSWKSALIPFLARIPQRIGWLGECRHGLLTDWKVLNKTVYPTMLARFLALGEPAGTNASELPRPLLQLPNSAASAIESHSQETLPILALCPGAEFGAAKQWPASHFAKLIQHFAHEQKTHRIILLGAASDQTMAHEITRLSQSEAKADVVQNLCGKTTLQQALAWLSKAHMVVTNDSGLMHMAAAINKPLVAVYGPTDPGFTPPLGNPQCTRILKLQLPCQPCFQRQCPLGHLACLNHLAPEQVIAAIHSIELN